MCEKLVAVPNSSIESEVISLDADLQMDGLTVRDLWDLGIEILQSSQHHTQSTWKPVAEQTQCEIRPNGRTKRQSKKSEDFGLTEIDYVTPNAKLSRHNTLL